jgi:sugar lactone lactonase YvrE
MILIPAPPIITSQPVSVAVKDGDSFSLYVAASGDGELSCQWQKDGVNLARATSTSLNISFSRMSDAGSYTAVISNAGGSVTSNSATVTITPPPPPTIDNQPSSASTASGSTAYFSVHASGLDPMTYQWQKDGVKLVNDARISGAKTANLSITPAQFNDSGQYSVIVTNDGGSVTSSSVLLSVSITNPPVVYNQAPTFGAVDELFADLISASGDPASFSAAGLPPGITINAATGLIMGTPTTSGTYNVSFTASNAIGTSAAGSLTLTILPPTVSSTFAGKLGTSGAVDSTTTTAARFNTPAAIMSDATGILYIADTGNHTIRKIALSGEVTTFAGQAGISGSLDGTGLNAQFSAPAGLAVDNSNNLYVADTGNNVIRKITPAGQVSTLAGAAGIAGTADGIDSVARFNHPSALAIDSSNTLYIADTDNHTIRTIALNSSPVSVSTLVGQAGIQGAADGWPNSATLNFPISLAIDSNNNLYVADNGNHTIRRVTSVASLPTVGTLAGKTGITGAADGAGSEALFNAPAGLTMDRDNILYVADTSNHTIRMVTVDDSYNTRVTTLAGLPGASGGIDGAGDHARLNYPCGMTIDPSGAVYIADDNNHAVRRIQRMPFITFQPRTLTELAGTDTGVAVHALGVPTPTFQWYKDGVAVPGATSAILNFPNAQPAQTGTYRVTATNPLGTVTSNSATLTITGDNGSSSSSGSSSSGGSSSGPASSSSGPSSSGGGGGAPSVWFFLTLTAVALSKSAKRRRNG